MEKPKKKRDMIHCSQSQNILRNLMLRDFGLRTTHKTSTRELEPIAETKLVLKDHKELVCVKLISSRIIYFMIMQHYYKK